MAPPPNQCPPCKLELRVTRTEQDAARSREHIRVHGQRLDHVEAHQENFAVQIDRLGDVTQRHELAMTRFELLLARFEGAVDVLTDRPSVVVNTPPQRPSGPASSLEVGAGKWSLRVRGMLPVALLIVAATAAALVYYLETLGR